MLSTPELLYYTPHEQRDHQLVMPGYFISLATGERGTLDHVHPRAVVALHVEVDRREASRQSAAQVPRDGERLEEHLRHDDRAAEVQHHAAIVDGSERVCEAAEVAMAGITDGRAARGRVLVDDLG